MTTTGIFASWFHLALGKSMCSYSTASRAQLLRNNRIVRFVMQSTDIRTGNNRAYQGQTWVEQCMSDLKAFLWRQVSLLLGFIWPAGQSVCSWSTDLRVSAYVKSIRTLCYAVDHIANRQQSCIPDVTKRTRSWGLHHLARRYERGLVHPTRSRARRTFDVTREDIPQIKHLFKLLIFL